MTKGIALGGHYKTEAEAKERVKNQKKRLVYIIKYNKLKIKPSEFKFEVVKEKSGYYTYVDTPEIRYNWIFLV